MSHSHEFVFLKTRKTAGTTVELALEALCRPPGDELREKTPAIVSEAGVVGRRLSPLPKQLRDRGVVDWRNHMPAAEIRDALGPERWRRYRKITAVRDPFDTAVSRYHWELARRGLPEAEDFAETRRRFRDLVTGPDFESDHDIVHIDGGYVADRAIRFERLSDDLEAVMAEIAPGSPRAPLAHAKRTSDRRSRPVADYYDSASVAAVRRAAAWAFDRFGYPESPCANASAASIEVLR